jgi:flavin reductase (DIM6/NTAB) family NADH-FMN oxidoreductase RutF
MPKPEYEFYDVAAVAWTPVDGRVPGLWERILARDDEGGVVTRILRFDPGTNTSEMGPQVHDYWEEVYILEGSLHDLTLDQRFPTGYFACRPPGMRHGPWIAPDGCLTFEVRYHAAPPGNGLGRTTDAAGERPTSGVEPGEAKQARPPSAFSATEFRRACAQFATGVTVVTTRAADGTPAGLTANAFASVSLEPPLVLLCLDRRLRSYRAFRESGRYAVHDLASHQTALATRFATRGADKFAGLTYRAGRGELPIIPGYLALFECVVETIQEAGDHTIFVGRVEGLDIGSALQPPLAFARGRFATLHADTGLTLPPEAGELWALGWA